MARRPPAMPVRAVRVDDETWRAANEAAVRRGEFLHDEIRAFLKRYAKTAPKTSNAKD
jgi:hypothetical protein